MDADSRLGYHGEAYEYLFSRPLIEKKIADLDEILMVKIPEVRDGRTSG
ncbi:MAG: hypothetical protein O2954_05530 [bacterium]|nr:hypothetical protein [bacterium]